MHRRDVLRLFSSMPLVGAETRIARANTERSGPGKGRTLVIGAGLAGLSAASALHREGREVVVLEARDRIGGRVWTSHRWPDMPLDLGATWIHGVQRNPITALADRIGARRVSTSYDRAMVYDADGRALDQAGEARLEKVAHQVRAALLRAQHRDSDVSVRQAVAMLAREFEDSPESTRFLNFILSDEIEHEYAGSAHDLSAFWYDSGGEFGGGDALFVDGFETITRALARELQVELSQVVEEIHWGGPGVRVVTRRGAFEGDHAVVTLPLGVLQADRVLFDPPLPGTIRHAISSLGMGVLNKCYLRFDEAFWPHSVDWLGYAAERHGSWTSWVSFKRALDAPVLLGFNAAERGREMEALSDLEIVDSAMQTLKTVFGAGIPRPIDHQVTRWGMDPFAQGSYSYNALHSTPEMRDHLAMPLDGKLLFAGEATQRDYFATTHGAWLSGVRAARYVNSL